MYNPNTFCKMLCKSEKVISEGVGQNLKKHSFLVYLKSLDFDLIFCLRLFKASIAKIIILWTAKRQRKIHKALGNILTDSGSLKKQSPTHLE